MVYAIRQKRKESALKRAAYHVYYRALRSLANIDIPLDRVTFACCPGAPWIRSMRFRTQSLCQGVAHLDRYRQVGLAYERHARASGEPSTTLRGLTNLALTGSSTPTNRSGSWADGHRHRCACAVRGGGGVGAVRHGQRNPWLQSPQRPWVDVAHSGDSRDLSGATSDWGFLANTSVGFSTRPSTGLPT